MEAVASRCLADLRDQRLRVAKQYGAQRPSACKSLRQRLASHPVAVAAVLHHGRVRHELTAQEQCNTDYPLAPHASGFGHLASAGHVMQRDHRRSGKVRMAQDFARLENHFAERHWHELKIGFNGA